MYIIKRHKMTENEKQIMKLVHRALLDRLDQLCHEQRHMVRSPWVSIDRAMHLTTNKVVSAVLMQIRYWMESQHMVLGEAEENLNFLDDLFQYDCRTGAGYRNHDHQLLEHAKRLPNGDYLVYDSQK